jgi:NAD(P)-dependent dehydrogenase (short-subunit alcohol dehydrogenase family)
LSESGSTPQRRKALVTGGTGSIGAATIEVLADRGFDVTFQFHRGGDAAAKLEEKTGASGFALDLNGSFELPKRDYHVLVNAAGILLTKTLAHEVSEQELVDTVTINLLAPFRACQQCLPFMMEQRYGRIVNIGSIYAERGCSDNSSYNVSKHGLLGLTRSLAHEYASYNIAVNQIDPSAVESEMMNRIAASNVERGRAESVEAYLDSVRKAIPAGRMADPKDIADGVIYLVEQSGFTTGATLPIDGGLIA